MALVSESDTFQSGKPLRVGLWLKLKPGWHTYWFNPGDAGAPPTIDITGAKAGPIVYPAPEKLVEAPFASFAYTGEVLLPLIITPPADAKILSLDADATWLVCERICVPENAKFHLDLPQGAANPGPDAILFSNADAKTPKPAPAPAHIAPDGTLWLAAPSLHPATATFFPAEAGLIDQLAPQPVRDDAGIVAIALKPAKPPLGHLAGELTLTGDDGAAQYFTVDATSALLPSAASPPAPPDSAPSAPASQTGPLSQTAATPKNAPTGPLPAEAAPGLLQALLLAFAGGLVLNLMPCVLPVLAMKALALARLGGAAREQVRREALQYTAGVVAAFALIGAVTLIAKAAGSEAGWGVQFQSALFTTLMAWLLFGIGLNLSGVFEIGAGMIGAGQGLASRGAFFTGLLAVVVATPCTAPFMGAALAAALALPPLAAMAIFLMLGFGLAAPYAALAAMPALARLLPRPGAWMETLKQLLAFPMYGAALWMVWVASQQVSPPGLAAVFLSLLLVGFAAWAFGRAQHAARSRLLPGLAALALAAGLAALFGVTQFGASAARAASVDGSEPFSVARLDALRAQHRPVLVDMSAAWCVTCLVNERVALSPDPVRRAFAAHKVAYLKGDWTRQDAAITAYLKANNRSGVPLYVYYPPDGAPTILPQLLSPALILQTIGSDA